MSRRPIALLLIVVAGSLLSVMLSIAVNLATGGNLPEPLAPYEKLAWPIVLVLTVATVALAVWERLAQQRANSLAEPPRSTAPPPKHDVEHERPLHNLPLQLTSFVGRERELGEVRRLLSSHRLLTLTGAGGCGKTRLALKTAAQLVDAYPDGVWLIELAALNDPALVAQTVASELGLREEPGHSVTALLCGHLQDREVLLVLDNCEHLVAACAELAQSLLRTCPKLHILATSREPLGAQGETTWQVPSLEVPAAGHSGARELLGRYEAVRLFAERAAAARPSFQLDEGNAAAVGQICRRLDGIPLAIELAAARVKGLSAQQIAARLDDRFRLLSAGIRTAPPRHQTLHAALNWSYGLLSQPEQVLFNRLSVFAGGFRLEATEAVCGGDGIDSSDILNLLLSLVNKSLVQHAEADGSTRYWLLETLRVYAAERLAAGGEERQVRRRHAAYFLTVAEEAEQGMTGAEQPAWLRRLEEEHDNLRLVLGSAVKDGQAELGLRLAGAIWRFWDTHGYLSEGRLWFQRLLALGQEAPPGVRAQALYGAGAMAWRQGDYEAATGLLTQSLALTRELGDSRGIARALLVLGHARLSQEDYEQAKALYEESLTTFQALHDKRGEAISLSSLGTLELEHARYSRAESLLEESLALRRDLADPQGIASALDDLGRVALRQGDGEHAHDLLRESLRVYQDLGDTLGIADSLDGLAQALQTQGRSVDAARLGGAAEAMREAAGASRRDTDRVEHDRMLEAIKAAIGDEGFWREWALGRAIPIDAAMALALEEASGDPPPGRRDSHEAADG